MLHGTSPRRIPGIQVVLGAVLAAMSARPVMVDAQCTRAGLNQTTGPFTPAGSPNTYTILWRLDPAGGCDCSCVDAAGNTVGCDNACNPVNDAVLSAVPVMVQNTVNAADPAYAALGFLPPYANTVPNFNILIYDIQTSGSAQALAGCIRMSSPSFCSDTASDCDLNANGVNETDEEVADTTQHEMFHSIQRAYLCGISQSACDDIDVFVSSKFGTWVAEGTAEMMQDKLFGCLDTGAGTGFWNQVTSADADPCDDGSCPPRGPILFPQTSLVERSYGSCLFWSYCGEQFGTGALCNDPTCEPEFGVDFMLTYWQNLQADGETGEMAAIRTLEDTILNAGGSSLDATFLNYSLANYTHNLNLFSLADPTPYFYVDEGQGGQAGYGTVPTVVLPMPPIGVDAPLTPGSVLSYGTQYFEANVGAATQCLALGFQGLAVPKCNDVLLSILLGEEDCCQSFPEVCTTEVLGWGAVARNSTGSVLGLAKQKGRTYAQTFLDRTSNHIARLGAVVAGLQNASQFEVRFGSGFPSLEITDPTTTAPKCVGSSVAPRTFVVAVRVDGPAALKPPGVGFISVAGLVPDDFRVVLSGLPGVVDADVLTAAYHGDFYLLTVSAQVPADGLYDLSVGLCDGVVQDTELDCLLFVDCTTNLVVVVDRSGSMDDGVGPECTKLDAAKEAAGTYVDAALAPHRVGVVAFWGDDVNCNNDGAEINTSTFPLALATGAQRLNAINFIEALNADDWTCIGDGLLQAQEQFAPHPGLDQVHEILLLSDGEENEAHYWDQVVGCASASSLIPDRTTIRTMAFGADADDTLMMDIAADTGGNFLGVVVDCQADGGATGDQAGAVAGDPDPIGPTTLVNRLTETFLTGLEEASGTERLFYQWGTAQQGVVNEITIPITEGGVENAVFFFQVNDRAAAPSVQLFPPTGGPIGPPAATIFDRNAHVVYHLNFTTGPGNWRAELTVGSDVEYIAGLLGRRRFGPPLTQLGVSLVQVDPGRECTHPLQSDEGPFKQGVPVTILGTLVDDQGGIRDATVEVTIIKPDGTRTCPLLMRDDASQNDGAADDGVYGLIFPETWQSSGTGVDNDPGAPPPNPADRGDPYQVIVHAIGGNNYEEPFQRWARSAFHVLTFRCDTDGDGLPDSWERYYGTDPRVVDANNDEERDGLRNQEEFMAGTHPFDPDSDDDGELDGSEVLNGRSPTCPTDSPYGFPLDVEVISYDPEDHEGRNEALRAGTILLRFPWYAGYAGLRVFRAADTPLNFGPNPFQIIQATIDDPSPVNHYDDEVDMGRQYFYRFQGVGADGGLTRLSKVVTGAPIIGGACCLPAGGCGFLTEVDCEEAGGSYLGDLTSCAPNDDCDPATMLPLNDGLNDHDNRCATNDGPADDGCYVDPADGHLFDELWYQYVATCTGQLTVSMCAGAGGGAFADYDAYLVAYGEGSPACACPIDESTELICSDDDCGVAGGPPVVTIPVTAGNCYTIAVGGWDDDTGVGDSRGTGVIHVECAPDEPPPEPPLPAPDGILRNRMVAFVGAAAGAAASPLGLNTAVRVTFLNLPSPYNVWNGRQLWVSDPMNVCEQSGVGPGQPCPPTSTTARFAELDCTPHCRSDWSALGTINTHHKGIVPAGTYRLQSIYCSDDLGDESRYSAPRDITTTRWGDCCGPFAGGAWSAPDGRVDVTVDVTAVLAKFANRTAAPGKARTDVEPARLDLKINISDVTRVLDAYRSIPFPFRPDGDPCVME